jgi:Lrp/AsnC family transcriptional regulator for asnA, asnC and gidA
MYKIDNIDIKILDILVEDGRMPSSEIARQIGNVSGRAVRYRIDQMVEEGIIEIRAILYPTKLGFGVLADVFIEVDTMHILDVAKALTEYDLVCYVGVPLGEDDVSVQFAAPDNNAVSEFVTEVIAKLPGVRKTKTIILPKVLKDTHTWRAPDGIVEAGADKTRFIYSKSKRR